MWCGSTSSSSRANFFSNRCRLLSVCRVPGSECMDVGLSGWLADQSAGGRIHGQPASQHIRQAGEWGELRHRLPLAAYAALLAPWTGLWFAGMCESEGSVSFGLSVKTQELAINLLLLKNKWQSMVVMLLVVARLAMTTVVRLPTGTVVPLPSWLDHVHAIALVRVPRPSVTRTGATARECET
ncbi:hypothetical protein IWX49DRAFT_80220 [Phyllosticta citricarpa]